MKYYLLIDWPVREQQFWLASELTKLGCDVTVLGIPDYNPTNTVIRWRKIFLWFQYLRLGIRAINQSQKNDIIISWNFVVGAITGFLNRFLRSRRKILSLNMIVHKKRTINTFVRSVLYRYVLGSDDFFVTLNTSELVNIYIEQYRISVKNFALLPDVLFDSYEDIPFDEGDGTIFSGGEASRDWRTLIDVALMNPQLKFRIIARRKYFPEKMKLPSNIDIKFDTSEEVFYSTLKKCSVIALPLTSVAPSGLIVLLRAAMLSRPIITTDTPSIRNYITHKVTGILTPVGDAKTFSDELRILVQSSEVRSVYATRCKEFIRTNFTPQSYAAKIVAIINSNGWVQLATQNDSL